MTSSHLLHDPQPKSDQPPSTAQTLLRRLAGLALEGSEAVAQDAHSAFQVPGCGVLQVVKGVLVHTPLLTAAETAAYLRLSSVRALYRLVYRNRIPFLRLGSNLRFDVRDLDAWLIDPAYRLVPRDVKARRARRAA